MGALVQMETNAQCVGLTEVARTEFHQGKCVWMVPCHTFWSCKITFSLFSARRTRLFTVPSGMLSSSATIWCDLLSM
eukprot:GDKH01026586.1.p2 GENE.GDKH01026586.1~~GDKH01026586.1.p2  ORF type:complete len:77 (+),score=0.56 GDKH01026586.1:2-232(+)